MMEIAAEVGVSRGPLYYYFSNKADLFRAVIHRSIEQQKTTYSQILTEEKPFLQMIEEDYLFCSEDKGFFFLMDPIRETEPELLQEWQEFSQWLIDLKYRAFSAAKARGELSSSCDISEVITFIYIYYYGVQQTKELSRELKGFSTRMLDHSVDTFLDIIRERFL